MAPSALTAVLLITRTRPGPKLVYHYPEIPDIKLQTHHDQDSDDSETETDEPADKHGRNSRNGPAVSGNTVSNGKLTSGSETVLGHSVETLEKLLSPGRWCDQKKFEICVNGLTFLGHPVYALADGEWTERPAENAETAAAKLKKPGLKDHQKYGEYHMYLDPGSLATTPLAGTGAIKSEHDFTHIPESLDSQKGLATSMESGSTGSAPASEQMAMFHVVFAMRPQGADGQREVPAMHDEVAKTLSRALHYCQKQSNYVSNESRRLLALRAKARQSQDSMQGLWKQMIETSELAWALEEVYECISNGEVAGIRLNGMEMSLHITRPEKQENILDPEPLSALLLLESKETLLNQLSHPDASPLAHFIREMTPTKNLQKHATNLGMPINDILYLARHLIKWRKARVIMPLHQRNIYVVSPNAPLENLAHLRDSYIKLFPTLPSLPNMLKVLSGKPIKYGLMIPSRDHRGAFMEILSFLARHDLVVQLKTSGWLRLPKHLPNTSHHPSRLDSTNKRPTSARGLLSPRLRATEDDTLSIHSDKTTIAAPTSIKTPSNPPPQNDDNNLLITHPTHPTPEQSTLLAHLPFELSNVEFRENFSLILPHLDGEHAFEEIAARVGVKRGKVEEWLLELEKKGWLVSVRWV
ncbi:hypothetical protein M409DRAFT_18562 [Zasmidium cellare ATCC 36951]|uniref:Nitrogen permease regulator 3 n=1 Tax=Zasmidium cellare ATCC 36951 TaxID=1080233 RepID=A0A6A6CWN6_ZASCE|nr:uncharacterized protein M409DRAFT_18562 [Zasmidium cellare ATCC 36951]KAF2171445.1 hypothetical protein M409DRAFT_18562 [Zasmidium cellare ATCC 36951]